LHPSELNTARRSRNRVTGQLSLKPLAWPKLDINRTPAPTGDWPNVFGIVYML